MKKVTLGRTNITSPKNAFGALPIQRISVSDSTKLLQKAYENGFTFFDTARSYTDSEEKLGIALSDVRKNITIATKTAAKTPDDLFRDLETSLKLLKCDCIDIYQLHNIPFCPKEGDGSGMYEALQKAKNEGMIKYIGLTNHRPNVALEAVESGAYDTLQYPFCYLAVDSDIRLVEKCKEKNVGFIAMKGLSGGLITNSKAAYAWMERFDNVLPIWGIQREWELDEFISYMNEPPMMNSELEAIIENDRKELLGNFCRACGYCMPCPQGIEINNCARMSQLIRRSPSAQWLTPQYQEKMMKIDDCIECGQCKQKCPFGLDTPNLLRQNLEDYKNILSGKEKV